MTWTLDDATVEKAARVMCSMACRKLCIADAKPYLSGGCPYFGGECQSADKDEARAALLAVVPDLVAEAVKAAKRDMLRAINEQAGEGIHTAFRKGSDSAAAHRVWVAMSDMPPEEWHEAINWYMSAMAFSLDMTDDLNAVARRP